MPNYFNGTEFVVQLGNNDGPPETFTTIACQRSTTGSINNEQIDVTAKCNTPWRQLLEGGIRSMSLSLSGVFNDDQSMADMIGIHNAGSIRNYRLISEYGDVYEGAFFAASMERSGEHTDAEQFSMTLESAGDISYTPPV